MRLEIVACLVAVLVGATATALFRHRFRLIRPDPRVMVREAVGGAVISGGRDPDPRWQRPVAGLRPAERQPARGGGLRRDYRRDGAVAQLERHGATLGHLASAVAFDRFGAVVTRPG